MAGYSLGGGFVDKQLTVLVADDSSQARLMVSRFISKLGYASVLAQSGEEAVALFITHRSDLILLDVQMSGIDGYETARRIREQAGSQWVPILFLSAVSDENEKIKGLESGGDDYLTKPVHFRMLEAKMKALRRIAEMQRLLRDNTEQLERYRDENEREQRLGKHLMDQIVRADAFAGEGVERWMMPAQHFSGDLVAAMHTPSGALHVILADGTGHGLSAALSVIPVTEVFYGMTERGFTIASIVRELNRKIKQLMPTGRFVAATVAAIDREGRTIEMWNGGNPTALFARYDGVILRSWPPMHPALGILGSDAFSDRTELFRWVTPGQLYMCSDGLLEAENAAGEAFGPERMARVIASGAPESRFGRIRTTVMAHLDGRPAHDDVSLLAIDCTRARRVATAVPKKVMEEETSTAPSSLRWRLGLRLSAAELKTIDILPFLMEWVNQVQVDQEHRGQIFLILAELFNNALDHGILGLDSSLKSNFAEGFERYIAERTARLAALETAFVEIEIEPLWNPRGEVLQLRIKDSGNGFNYQSLLTTDISQSTKRGGRGIALIRDLCSQVTYLGSGNEVVVHYIIA
jgi:two-component system, HptB-dependent secretion and biofilm response regulator